MINDSTSRPDAGADRWEEKVRPSPHTPWDQPEQPNDHGIPAGLRPHQQAGGVHPGWASTSQDAYDNADSGGWGVPGQLLTGPIPKLRPEADQRPAADAEAEPEAHAETSHRDPRAGEREATSGDS